MGDIPADRGGTRVLFDDVNQVGISTMIGDLAAMNLRTFHCLAAGAVPDANRAHIDALIAHNHKVYVTFGIGHMYMSPLSQLLLV